MKPPTARQAWVLAALWPVGLLALVGVGWYQAELLMRAQAGYGLHDTYYVVAHWHYVLSIGLVLLLTGTIYALLAWRAVAYRFWLGVGHLALTLSGLAMIFLTPFLFISAPAALDYDAGMETLRKANAVSSSGYVVILTGWACFAALWLDLGIRRLLDRRKKPVT